MQKYVLAKHRNTRMYRIHARRAEAEDTIFSKERQHRLEVFVFFFSFLVYIGRVVAAVRKFFTRLDFVKHQPPRLC